MVAGYLSSPAESRVVGCLPNRGQVRFAIGHSFLSQPVGNADEAWLYSVVEDEIIPLLNEYWFDEPVKAEQWADKLRAVVA